MSISLIFFMNANITFNPTGFHRTLCVDGARTTPASDAFHEVFLPNSAYRRAFDSRLIILPNSTGGIRWKVVFSSYIHRIIDGMPTAEENARHWNAYTWPEDGGEWSAGAGGTALVWHGFIMPRIFRFLRGHA
jgi:hypothetical protein